MLRRSSVDEVILKSINGSRRDAAWRGSGSVSATFAISDILVTSTVSVGTKVEVSFENEDEEELASVSTEYVLKFVVPDGQQPEDWINEVGEQELLTFGEEALYSYHRQAISELTSRMGLPPYRLPFDTESPADQSLDAENSSNEL